MFLPFSLAALGKLLSLSGVPFPPLKIGDDDGSMGGKSPFPFLTCGIVWNVTFVRKNGSEIQIVKC